MMDMRMMTPKEAREHASVQYEIDDEMCFEISGICVYRHDGVWHAYGETKDGDEVDTLWADAGTYDLMQMMRDVLGVL